MYRMRLSTTSPLFVHKVSRVIKIEKNVLDHNALSKMNYIMLAKRGAYYVITNSDIMQISHRIGRAFHHELITRINQYSKKQEALKSQLF